MDSSNWGLPVAHGPFSRQPVGCWKGSMGQYRSGLGRKFVVVSSCALLLQKRVPLNERLPETVAFTFPVCTF